MSEIRTLSATDFYNILICKKLKICSSTIYIATTAG